MVNISWVGMVSEWQPPASRSQVRASRSLDLMSDGELVQAARAGTVGAAEALLRRYLPLVRSRAGRFFIAGADPDDVLQEGMVGLTQAISSYRIEDSSASFASFAEVCVTRRLHTAVRNASRQKHQTLNLAVGEVYVRNGKTDQFAPVTDPVCPDGEHRQEWIALCFQVKQCLTGFEEAVLSSYLQGQSYQEMSDELMCQRKAIDNALQRARRKIQSILTV
jgi:RNA polymerase sporulation-specific sigma factor